MFRRRQQRQTPHKNAAAAAVGPLESKKRHSDICGIGARSENRSLTSIRPQSSLRAFVRLRRPLLFHLRHRRRHDMRDMYARNSYVRRIDPCVGYASLDDHELADIKRLSQTLKMCTFIS